MEKYLNDRDYCSLMRRRYNLKLKTIADYIGCSISMLSKYERGLANIEPQKVRLYVKFIQQYENNQC
ncbi:helix-turn-helix domain-containing protein [Clostridium punense]|uniref:helix-turn-helix domain-containing protein n=1 Tax=Clostridium TaxID=1485 RepID=UPI00038A3171|nr:helix-turn-helix transcriptional regulator [Clostridium sp. BL8]EQB87207.1 hypothetical protein M918_10140 [Clostridium sp. BL8]